MASPNDTLAVTTDINSNVGFFDLPPELRDEIYDLAFEHDRPNTQGREAMELNVRAPQPHLRLVNKQFTSEYDQRSPSTNNICLLVTGDYPTGILLSVRGLTCAAQASAVDIALTFDPLDDSMYDYVPRACFWLFDLITDVPYVTAVHLEFRFAIPLTLKMINWFSRAAHRAVSSIDLSFTSMQRNLGMNPLIQITQVDAMLVTPEGNSDGADSASDKDEKVATWTPARGHVRDVGLAEICRKYGSS
jgi:hypothetical protein